MCVCVLYVYMYIYIYISEFIVNFFNSCRLALFCLHFVCVNFGHIFSQNSWY